jgi:predicted dehydrogenase
MILRDGQITIPKVRMSEPLQQQDADFLSCIRTRRTPVSDARCGLAVVSALEAALESLHNQGRTMPVPGA